MYPYFGANALSHRVRVRFRCESALAPLISPYCPEISCLIVLRIQQYTTDSGAVPLHANSFHVASVEFFNLLLQICCRKLLK